MVFVAFFIDTIFACISLTMMRKTMCIFFIAK